MKRDWTNLLELNGKHEVSENEFLKFELPNDKTRSKCDLIIKKEMKNIIRSMITLIVLGIIMDFSFTILGLSLKELIAKIVSIGFIILGIILIYNGIKQLIPASKNLKKLKTNMLKYLVMECEAYQVAFASAGSDPIDVGVIKLCKDDMYLNKEFVVNLNLYHEIKDERKINVILIKLDSNYYVC